VAAFLGVAAIAAAILGIREKRKRGKETLKLGREKEKLEKEKGKLEKELEQLRLPTPWKNKSTDISSEVSSTGAARR
jgi:hypothetical protein